MLYPYSTEKLTGLKGVIIKNISDNENFKPLLSWTNTISQDKSSGRLKR